MQKKITLLVILLLSCGYKPNSKGDFNELIIITSDCDKVKIIPVIDKIFSEIVYTPQPEKKYNINLIDIVHLDKYKDYSNLIIVSLDQTKDSTVDVLYDKISKKFDVKENIFSAIDVFANSQILIGVKAFDEIQLEEIFINNNKWILSELNQSINNNIRISLNSNQGNKEIEELILTQFMLVGNIGEDYKVIKNNIEGSFLWIGRGYPYRWIVFNKINKLKLDDPYVIWDKLVELYKINMPDIIISDKFRQSQVDGNINKKSIRMLRGLYEHLPSNTGGPFVSYIFDDSDMDELILISGFVNFPENEKYRLIKQLELVITALTIKE